VRQLQLGLVVIALFAAIPGASGERALSGYLSLEPRVFVDDPLFAVQPEAGISPSIVLAPEFTLTWNGDDNRMTLAPYVRWDGDDDERTHTDLREALWSGARGPWTWRVGLGRVFWGVTESRHLVDIVNQTDWVEDIDEEDKLGQPMIAVERWTATAGSFSVFLLPGFRERTFPAADARLQGSIPVATDSADYESGAGRRRVDWALRWADVIGRWDAGVSVFYGTAREPRLVPAQGEDGTPVLIPSYDVIRQVGLDLQYTRNAWLWKLETIGRSGHGDTFAAAVAGVEYTVFGIAGGDTDLGLLLEYLYDGRAPEAPPTIYDDDWFVGARLAFNDIQGTSILGGVLYDEEGMFALLEGARRLGNVWRLEVEARWFVNIDPEDRFLSGLRQDSFVTFRLARYF